jgi:hypothetical protein
MRSVLATSLVAASLCTGTALAEESLGWYEDNWEATTFELSDGSWGCSVDSRADNFPDADGTWVFVYPDSLQFAPNTGVPPDGVASVSVDNNAPIPMFISGGSGYVADEDNLPLVQALAHGTQMTIEVWTESRPNEIVEYVYSLNGFRESYLRIASQCQFDPSPVLDAPAPAPAPAPAQSQEEPSEGSSLFGRDKDAR